MSLEQKLCLCFIKVRHYLDYNKQIQWQDNSSTLGAQQVTISTRKRPHFVMQVTLGRMLCCRTVSFSQALNSQSSWYISAQSTVFIRLYIRDKGKFFLTQVMEADMNGGIAPLIFNLGTARRSVVSLTPRTPQPWERTRGSHRVESCMGIRNGLDVRRRDIFLSLSGFEQYIFQPVTQPLNRLRLEVRFLGSLSSLFSVLMRADQI